MKPANAVTAFTAAVSLLSLWGCGTVAVNRARSDAEASKAAYKTCLERNPQTVSNCEGTRLAYEADLKNLNALTGGASTMNNTVTVGVPK